MARFDPDLNYEWIDGNTYSISWYHTPTVMFYNKKMMEAAGLDSSKLPQTYSEYYDFAQKVTNVSEKKWAMAPWMGEEWWRWQFVVYPFYIAATGSNQTVNTDGQTVMFNNPNGVKALEFFETLFDNDWAAKELYDVDPFLIGQAASAIGRTDMIKNVKNDAASDFEYVIGPIPIPDGNTRGKYDTYAFVRNFCIIDELGVPEGEERDRTRRASWEFMKFLLTDAQAAADFAISADLPCLEGLKNNASIAPVLNQYGQAMNDVLNFGTNSVIFDLYTTKSCDIQDPLTKSYLKVAYNEMSAAEAMAWAEQEANKILAGG